MPANLLPNGKNQFFTTPGVPAVGYKIATFAAGTSSNQTTWADAGKVGANTNPIILDARGEAVIFWDGVYKVQLQDATGVPIWTVDNISSNPATSGSLIPLVDNTYTLGSATFSWANLYLGAGHAAAYNTNSGNIAYYKQTAGEATVGVVPTDFTYPPGNVLRYGIVPNSSGSAIANTAALRALVSYNLHNTGWTGDIVFPNITGADVYYFSNYLDFRPGIDVDLNWCTLNFNKVADATDPNSGFVSAIRDFSIRNGYIVVASTCANGGHGIMFGARGTDGTYFVPLYDSTQSQPMGNIRVENIKVSSVNTGNRCIFMLGGLQDVSFENVWADGGSVADGIYYEYGWATDAGGVLANRQSSHAHNLSFKNIKVTNIAGLGGIVCNGAYNVSVDGLYVSVAPSVCAFGPGEAWYYRPWANVDDGNVSKRTVTLKNIVGKGITNAGISIVGANNASTLSSGYLQATINALGTPQRWEVLTDRLSASIDGFYMNGTVNNHGIAVQGADKLEIANGTTDGFQRAINFTAEVTRYSVRNVNALNSTGIGVNIGGGFAVWTPTRLSIGNIEGCLIAGSGTAGTSAAISVANSYACHIRNNRFGYEVVSDGFAETTQAQGVNVGATGAGVICDNNYVAGTSGGAVAYLLAGSVNSRGCVVFNPSGITTLTGVWGGVQGTGLFQPTYSASMTPDASSATNVITATNASAFTINAPANAPSAINASLTLRIRNASGGALGAVTFNAIYKLSAWTQPANGFSRSITFEWDGTNWIQSNQTGVDVPN